MKITIIRHTSLNIGAGICYGQADIDVSERFEKEAKFVLSKIQNRKYDAVYSSPLKRCTQLAEFCGYPNPTKDKRLMEMSFGNWECKYWDKINDPQLQKWYKDWIYESPTNGESFEKLTQRVREFVNELCKQKHQQVLIFTHAGVIRSMATILKIYDVEKVFDLKIEYGQVVELEI